MSKKIIVSPIWVIFPDSLIYGKESTSNNIYIYLKCYDFLKNDSRHVAFSVYSP